MKIGEDLAGKYSSAGEDPQDTVSVAAASATTGTDLLSVAPPSRTRNSPNDRVLKAFGLAGSVAANDSAVDVFIDTFYVGRFRNTRGGAVAPNLDDLVGVGALGWPAGATLYVIVVTAPATNPLVALWAWDDL